MTKDRIVAAEHTIEELLPPRELYVINTSQYEAIRARLVNAAGERRGEEGSHEPMLRKRNRDGAPTVRGKQAHPL